MLFTCSNFRQIDQERLDQFDTITVANKGIANITEHFLKVVLEEKLLAGNKAKL